MPRSIIVKDARRSVEHKADKINPAHLSTDKIPVSYGHLNIPFLDVNTLSVSQEALAQVPAKWAVRFKVFPVSFEHQALTLAIADTPTIELLQELDFYLKTTIVPVRSTLKEIEELIRTHYGVGAQIVEEMIAQGSSSSQVQMMSETDDEPLSDASVAKLVEQLIRQGFAERATDIHIEPRE